MNETTYVLTGDQVLETLRAAVVVRDGLAEETAFPRNLAEPVLTLVYDAATGRFFWRYEIPPDMVEVTAKLLESLPDDVLAGLDPAAETWIAELPSPQEKIVAAVQLNRIATELSPDRLGKTTTFLRDATLRLFEAGVVGLRG